jgi:dolichol kinase
VLADFPNAQLRTKTPKEELKAELVRKGIHVFIAVVPGLASISLSNTALLLIVGTLFYTAAESIRFLGFSMPMISPVTEAVLRKREQGHFALAPVTLGLGALLALLLFPAPVAAAAIYVLAFGDSVSSLVGKFMGRIHPAFLNGKSLEGSLACIITSFLAAFFVFREWKTALAVGLASLLIDALPLREYDNLFLPLAAGLAALIFQA